VQFTGENIKEATVNELGFAQYVTQLGAIQYCSKNSVTAFDGETSYEIEARNQARYEAAKQEFAFCGIRE
jgi:hypothetical protein